ncbi:MAG: arginine repressor [Sporomusaceae bacterium]|nr:arginine repressor [Sporomusaceae bacterium]
MKKLKQIKESKEIRHTKIKDLVEGSVILTQEELTEALAQHGIKATQATVSRDIKELMLIKTPMGDGRYRYAAPTENANMSQNKLERTFKDSLEVVDYSVNIVVLKTSAGMAQALAHNIDYLKWPEILGTVAGDDTIFVLVKSIDDAPLVAEKFRALQK